MRTNHIRAIAFWSVLLGAPWAVAQDGALRARDALAPPAAILGEDGVLKPINPPRASPQIVGEARFGGKDIDNPCPNAATVDPDAARDLVLRVASEEGFFPDFVLSVSKVESGFVSNSFSGRAYGLMQLTLETAARFGVDICNPEQNVRGGIFYLRHLHARFRNPFYILAAYNAGEKALANGLPPYPETLNYVARVTNDFYDWPKLAAASDEDRARSRGAKSAASATPASLRSNSAGRAAPAKPSASGGAVEWQSGFVANLD
jgi:hypothetical protein